MPCSKIRVSISFPLCVHIYRPQVRSALNEHEMGFDQLIWFYHDFGLQKGNVINL